MILRKPSRPTRTTAYAPTEAGQQTVMPTEPIPYEITPRGQGEYLPTKGAFRKGEDDRRHTFTREECQRGYRNAVESLLHRFPGCDPHFLMCAITNAQPWHKLPDVQRLLARDEPLTDAEAYRLFARG